MAAPTIIAAAQIGNKPSSLDDRLACMSPSSSLGFSATLRTVPERPTDANPKNQHQHEEAHAEPPLEIDDVTRHHPARRAKDLGRLGKAARLSDEHEAADRLQLVQGGRPILLFKEPPI